MTDEIALAFAHPAARAAATAGADPLDRISVSDHVREVEIGAFQSERGVAQRVRFNLVVEVRRRAEVEGDDVDAVLSYDTLVEAVEAELVGERINLLETLAARIADRILGHPLAARVFVRTEKLDRGPFALGVEIVRSAPERPRLRPVDAVAPRVVLLSNATIARGDLAALLDALQSGPAPVILCVGPGEASVPRADHPRAQRRIDLLAIEQTAWVLAGRDRRCVVVDSRTELDWAMKHGKISVWAPSKLVLGAHEPPAGGAEALAVWLAHAFDALEVVALGCDLPPTEGLAHRTLRADAMP